MSGKRRRSTEQGFTLIEVVMASVPMTLIALVLFATFGFVMSFARRGEARVEVIQEARLALHVMAAELREASVAPGAIVILSRDDDATQDGIGFLIARADVPGRSFITNADGTPRWEQAVFYVHDPVRGEVRRLATASTTMTPPSREAPARILARQVKHFRVERQRNLVTIALTIRVSPGETVLQTAVVPRN